MLSPEIFILQNKICCNVNVRESKRINIVYSGDVTVATSARQTASCAESDGRYISVTVTATATAR
jgi:hypothetical protein